MMRIRMFALAASLALLAAPAMAAEVDLSKLTCKQAAEMGPAATVAAAAWASGYSHGKSNSTMMDLGSLTSNLDKVKTECSSKPDSTVSSIIEGMK